MTRSTAAPETEQARRLRKFAHDLRGTGAAYGFPAITTRAGALEDSFAAGSTIASLAATVSALADAVRSSAAEVDVGLPEECSDSRDI